MRPACQVPRHRSDLAIINAALIIILIKYCHLTGGGHAMFAGYLNIDTPFGFYFDYSMAFGFLSRFHAL